MHRTLGSLALAATAAVALSGCVIAPPGSDPYGFGFVGGSAPYGSGYDEFDPAVEERWQDENRAWELDFAESVATELAAAGSPLAPAEGESLEVFRHVVVGVGYEWCDRLYIDEGRMGDAGEHAEQAERYGWTAEEYRIVVEAAEPELCGY
ncbi:hypothetical protein [Agrococcus sp. DT81.2]|uniref:hypothetical protein n=1 Tax=Agrococcus sp. DT81.2 TaxID=3393414 RepID=UPI003CE5A680